MTAHGGAGCVRCRVFGTHVSNAYVAVHLVAGMILALALVAAVLAFVRGG